MSRKSWGPRGVVIGAIGIVLAACSSDGDLKPGKVIEARWYDRQADKVVEICRSHSGERFVFAPILEGERRDLSREVSQRTYDHTEGFDRGHYIDIDTGDVYCYWHVDYPALPDWMSDTGWQPGECPSKWTDHGCPP